MHKKIDLKNLDKKNWKIFRFNEIASKISETVSPEIAEVDIYVGLEHLDREDIHIRRYGTPNNVKGNKLRCYPGDVIFGKRRAYQRKAAIVDFEGICSAHAFVFRANEDVIDSKLFPFFLHSDSFMNRMVDISVGGLSPTINWGDLKHQEFLLPSKNEQAKLAELLWKIDDSINKEFNLKITLRSLLYSLVKDLFLSSKKTIPIKECILENKNEKIPEGYTPYVEIGDIQLFNKLIEFKQKKSVKGALLAKKGSTLVSNVRPNRGAISILNSDQVISTGFTILFPDTKLVIKDFLFNCLAWNNSFTDSMARISSGTAYPTITDDDVKNYKIPFLTISQQEVFCQKLNNIYKAMLNVEDFINKTKTLNKSIIKNIF